MNKKINNWLKNINNIYKNLKKFPKIIHHGILVKVTGLLLEVQGLVLPIGSICYIERYVDNDILEAQGEVINFKKNKLFVIVFCDNYGFYPGARVYSKNKGYKNNFNCLYKIPLGKSLLGRVLNGLGQPLDGRLLKSSIKYYNLISKNFINPMNRFPISDVFDVGIRSINALLTIGVGQRIGIFSQAGLGKSFLLGMIAKYSKVDIVVIGLIGERGREIKEFIENILGKKGLLRAIVIASPSNSSALLKIKGAEYATRVAEYFRDLNFKVLLIIDSLTRYILSQREVSLSCGEFPSLNGYPTSVFSKISNLLERSGNGKSKNSGSITAFYTILTDINENLDFISNFVKSILDGHIILSKNYFNEGIFPAIDISSSMSRVMSNIVTPFHYKLSILFKKYLFSLKKNKDLLSVGVYVRGNNLILDKSLKIQNYLKKFLKQDININYDFKKSIQHLKKIF
ncbi:MAG: FliI/YscN family ATPase [Buchnera aphidicola (Periphyllus lyropictus)]|uniref:FliI/YscN family ATPase n=1 Tax=Buchnera aphidicola TaxID=9 RepID=UPI001EB52F13|nr:FliI/YscN family ATPase [Buchnera aphidicola]NIH16750.1 FliI/YscN family ATPase [Buchnera aphidicola (Periphyllus lyropictus)]USS94651.1 FliI/YscN family ATPase [Buchnera aphidicola (Periphyllus lyropictus)]